MTAAPSRLARLDMLRAAAIVLVLGRHMVPLDNASSLTPFTRIWQHVGWMGVDLFFVISGFLVSGLLFREHQKYGKINLGRFFMRRGMKIYPAFYVFLAASVAMLMVSHQALPWKRIASEILFTQSYFTGLWPHTWSLAVEEHFYLLAGLGLCLCAKRKCADPFRGLPVFFAAVATVVLTMRTVSAGAGPVSYESSVFPTHLRIDALLLGVTISYLHHYKADALAGLVKHRTAWWALAGALLISPAFFLPLESRWMVSVGFTSLYLGFGCLLLATIYTTAGVPAPLRWTLPVVAVIGVNSYSIYLWHQVIVTAYLRTSRLGADSRWSVWELVGYVVASVLVGWVMARVVEQPFLKLRDRLFPSRSGGLATLPSVAGTVASPGVSTPSIKRAA